ncbi:MULTISPECIES: hypothetical protein [Rathayibacter]|uniref:hypothetical protein n=1 Tax=Rathayibacter TaxID=33886 RepID=UPI001316E7A7|nr:MULTISPECIES: hypothetical protein [Rathayibacter]MDY0914503.1 hypothetical protein [Rathayibacter festucae]QHC68869.1 hypothetical protein GSU68_19325 [Rathayibacter sp. VKM Ac-2759]
MPEFIEDCDLYAAMSYPVTVSNGRRVIRKLAVKARINTETGQMELYVDPSQLDQLQK